MHVAPQSQVTAVFQDAQEVFRGFAQMDVDRKVEAGGQLELDAQGLPLLPGEFGPVVVVEPDFADGDDLTGDPFLQLEDLLLPALVDGARIQAQHRTEDAGIALGEREHPFPFPGIDVGLEHHAYTRRPGTGDDGVFLSGKRFVRDVGMAVYVLGHEVQS